MFTLPDLQSAHALVQTVVRPTAEIQWPLLSEAAGAQVWVKHENHLPTGAFKMRGGIVYVDELVASGKRTNGLISATRGNHGQSIALAATRAGIPVTILVPHGNSVEKNAAMRAYGARLIEHGADFDEARLEAARLAETEGLDFVPSFHPALVKGVATYALELFTRVPDIDTVYAPIGMGSGICGIIKTRDLLGLKTKIVGVVADAAPAIALSFEAKRPVPTNRAPTFADGMATRDPQAAALDILLAGAERVVRVTDDEIAEAMRLIYRATHNIAEGAGAAALAALLQERARHAGRKVAVILSGGNIDRERYLEVLAGRTPSPG
ncbi:MAG: threonine dehydratase [Hyphomicrobiaceae bacterium]